MNVVLGSLVLWLRVEKDGKQEWLGVCFNMNSLEIINDYILCVISSS